MSSLTIVTTYPDYLPKGKESKNGLFPEQYCIVKKASALKNHERNEIYRRKSELVFGVQCLDKDNEKDKAINKSAFIKALFEDIINSLNEEEKNAIQEIYFFGHSYDLGSTTASIMNMDGLALLKDLEWLKNCLPTRDIKIGTGELRKEEGDLSVSIYFTAFSHVKSASIFRFLEKIDSDGDITEDLGKLAKYLVKGAWELDRQQEIPELNKQYFSDIKFNCLYWTKDQFKKTDSSFIWQANIIEKIKGEDGGYEVNLIFLPVVALSEQMDRTVYDAIREDEQIESTPTIFIGYWDIMLEDNGDFSKYYSLDRRIRFLDSSIWFRYVAIEGNFWDNLNLALETIRWAYDNRLYQKNVCQEFREFQLRLINNSYLEEKFGSGHSKRVFPFTFHSETAMKSMAVETALRLSNTQLIWNVLLVDDFAGTSLKEGSSIGTGPNKGEIIKNLLQIGGNRVLENSRIERFAKFDCITTIEDAVNTLGCGSVQSNENSTIYDIILLDYLFSHSTDEKAQKYPYGTALLDIIHEATRVDGIGVMQSYWIYPISVFNEAIQSDMQEKGYQYMENRWQLARGADPLNTPHLFQRSLFKFMEAQAQKVQFMEQDIWDFVKEEMPKLLNQKKENEGMLDRIKAMSAFRKFIERFSMDEDLPKHSALANSIQSRLITEGVKDLRDHLSQLLYLLGFSVGFDFPVIEQEFRAVEEKWIEYKNAKIMSNSDKDRIEKEKIDNAMQSLATSVYSIYGKYY